MSNPTKILMYDLESSIRKLLEDLNTFQGSYSSLYERLNKLDVSVFDGDTKSVIQDLIDAYRKDNKGLTRERINSLESQLASTQDDVVILENKLNSTEKQILLSSIIETSKYEEYQYDSGGNVIHHRVYADNTKAKKIYEISFTYDSPESGVLQSSQKKVYEEDGVTLKQTVNKVYNYDSQTGDIISIATTVV
ncbi:MAG TPA: hypothetical protein VEY51_14725 [Chondromyces sp.]|nr:hypothetical protein [Chondromyces sp.]